MLRNIKCCFWIALLAAGVQQSWGFAVLGPVTGLGAEVWQSIIIGYDEGPPANAYVSISAPGDPVFLGDLGGPHNIGEEYRRNTPILYYTYDQSFLNFFGVDGASSVDSAFSLMNSLPSADKLDVSQYPLEASHINYRAQGLYLTDLKSVTLHLLVEQLGLGDAERFTWTLHDRNPGIACPYTAEYTVVSRNFDYLTSPLNQIQYSTYVNDILYSYWIEEFCTGPATLAFTDVFAVDPEATTYTTVAANTLELNAVDAFTPFYYGNSTVPTSTGGGLPVGYFYSGLTRDDVAGLKYLYTTNKVDLEYADPTSFLFSVTTNLTTEALFPSLTATNAVTGTNGFGFYIFDGSFGYGDYGALLAAAQTNSPAVLQALYPGLVITSSTNYYVLATNWIYQQYFTNIVGIGTPYPAPLTLVTASNGVPYLQQKYVTTFANVFEDPFHPWRTNSSYQLQTTVVQSPIGSPYGSPLATNTTSVTITLTNVPSGDFFLLPSFHTNVCPVDILYTGLTNVVTMTNQLTSTLTNLITVTNSSTYSATLSQVFTFTNYTFVVHPTVCGEPTNTANLYQGVGGIKFARHDYDSLVGQYFQPITNSYPMVMLTNSHWQTVQFTRVIIRPDILVDAADEGGGGGVPFVGSVERTLNFTPSPAAVLGGPVGPGTIVTPTIFTYDKMGESAWNGYEFNSELNNFFLTVTNGLLYQQGEIPALAWGSFDSSTNDPIVYPNGTSIATLESILTVNFTPTAPPDGYVGTAYTQTFTVGTGLLQPPLTWMAANLPPGMALTTAANQSDFVLSGTPTTAGVYNFIVQLALPGAPGRNTQWNFSITIH